MPIFSAENNWACFGKSMKDCVYIGALEEKQKSSRFYVHALLVFSLYLPYTACGTVDLHSRDVVK